MAKCSRCGADTVLHEKGVPICVACATAEDEKRKPQGSATDADRHCEDLRERKSG